MLEWDTGTASANHLERIGLDLVGPQRINALCLSFVRLFICFGLDLFHSIEIRNQFHFPLPLYSKTIYPKTMLSENGWQFASDNQINIKWNRPAKFINRTKPIRLDEKLEKNIHETRRKIKKKRKENKQHKCIVYAIYMKWKHSTLLCVCVCSQG